MTIFLHGKSYTINKKCELYIDTAYYNIHNIQITPISKYSKFYLDFVDDKIYVCSKDDDGEFFWMALCVERDDVLIGL